ncbi:hypothetical protein [Saccharopolyspora sp. 6V]|uniref:hypothetical protein n=1 Tax=Saccharopolyspora sp. 6V TaxID=2877239 RepID=UPI001CD51360|nr:hypothetical protein [Saccharopolyspora sp. 6V]MCA1191645.1 hypothetical protein [Saccharopolyspora sp. 6V]
MATRQRVPRRVRRDQRAAAEFSARLSKARSPKEQYRVAADALVSALKHHGSKKQARDLREQLVQHAENGMATADLPDKSRDHLRRQLDEKPGVGVALAVLQSVIDRLPSTERDRLFVHYSQHFLAESRQIESRGGGR